MLIKSQEQEPIIVEGLLNKTVSKKDYVSGELYLSHFFEQYKLYLESAEKVSDRRNTVNAFFLTLNSIFLTGLGLAIAYSNEMSFEPKWMIFFITFVLISLCYVWQRTIRSYRQLNTAKFKVIGQFEKSLPTSPFWSAEWKSLGEGKKKSKYWPVTDLEKWIPRVFMVLYIVGSIWFSIC